MAEDLPATHVPDRRWDALGNLSVLPDDFICAVIESLSPRDVCRLACVSSVMYIFCNEEPLWMSLCLKGAKGQLQYKGSWKQTALHLEKVSNRCDEYHRKLHFDGFNSIFLYRRLYRCYTQLNGFSFDSGNVERREGLSLDRFQQEFDGKKPVLLNGLADTWLAKSTWTIDQLLLRHGQKAFRISQMSCGKIKMSLEDYVSYIQHQHDEDPLYIFDEKFGEVAPDLLKDYSVPHLFQEDFFDVLDREQRPPYRWLIIGPERSGASWHTDPALTSAWNTLLCGRKRWALYPPGKVPMGVTVHVDEEGDVNVDTPSSLQWWLDYYPLLADDDKPIECTQLPGETIFVPSGWWHCVLNLDTTIAVTQNFVNSKNFEFVCLDMAPGYRHKGVCRAGFLALDGDAIEDAKRNYANGLSCSDQTVGMKGFRTEEPVGESNYVYSSNGASKIHSLWKQEFSYDINFLATFLDKDRDHYNARWSPNNSIGQRELREWLCKLWAEKQDMRELIWKGACLALNADKWAQCLAEICAFYNLPSVADDDKLPVGTGSNPVYLVADNVVKIFVEDGLDACMHSLGAELEFYNQLDEHNSPLKNHIPAVLASGIICLENGCYRICEWDGRGVPDVISKCNLTTELSTGDYEFGVWSKLLFEYRKGGRSSSESVSSAGCSSVWPFIITKRCKGKILAQLGDTLSKEALQSLASFLGEQLHNLHILPYPSLNNPRLWDLEGKMNMAFADGSGEALVERYALPSEWEIFIRTLNSRKKDLSSRLTEWGNPIPDLLVEKIKNYIPDNFEKLLDISKQNDIKVSKHYSWIHKDIMVDNIYMEPRSGQYAGLVNMDSVKSYRDKAETTTWCPSYLLDFSNISVGDPLWELIPLHLDVFKGDSRLLKEFLESYKLPFLKRITDQKEPKPDCKFGRLSYHAMCYCILHEDNVIAAIFDLWKELRTANSWEEVEETVWGELNNYVASCCILANKVRTPSGNQHHRQPIDHLIQTGFELYAENV